MDKKKWEVLKSEYLFNRPWLTVRKDAVKLPDGVVNEEYYVLEYPSWVNVIATTETGEFVMVEQYRHGWGDYFTELCAGVVEEGEDPEHAARRELEEETGYTGGEWRLLSVISSNPGSNSNKVYCYVAEGVKKTTGQHLDKTEDVSVRILSLRDVARMLAGDELKQSLMVAPLMRYLFGKQLDEMAE